MQHTKQLLEIMARLRDPQKGCPWDIAQDFKSITQHTLEEAYEVVDTIENNDMKGLMAELGDLLFQVVFYTQMADEQGLFDFEAVAEAMNAKLIARHPHIFGDKTGIHTADEQTEAWEELKVLERKAKAEASGKTASVLDDVSRSLPSLLRASKLQKRAAKVGFNWKNIGQVFDKLEEEVEELHHELAQTPQTLEKIEDELGDIFFVLCNISNWLKVNPEEALRKANKKFERRFHYIEQSLATQGRTPTESTLEEMDNLWNEAKGQERAA